MNVVVTAPITRAILYVHFIVNTIFTLDFKKKISLNT